MHDQKAHTLLDAIPKRALCALFSTLSLVVPASAQSQSYTTYTYNGHVPQVEGAQCSYDSQYLRSYVCEFERTMITVNASGDRMGMRVSGTLSAQKSQFQQDTNEFLFEAAQKLGQKLEALDKDWTLFMSFYSDCGWVQAKDQSYDFYCMPQNSKKLHDQALMTYFFVTGAHANLSDNSEAGSLSAKYDLSINMRDVNKGTWDAEFICAEPYQSCDIQPPVVTYIPPEKKVTAHDQYYGF